MYAIDKKIGEKKVIWKIIGIVFSFFFEVGKQICVIAIYGKCKKIPRKANISIPGGSHCMMSEDFMRAFAIERWRIWIIRYRFLIMARD